MDDHSHSKLPEDDYDDIASDTTSINSPVSPQPIRAYGHTYHPSARLFTPNDNSASTFLSLQHALYTLCLDGALTCTTLPQQQAISILDVGSGNGLWAVEMGRLYPQASILGIDISGALLPGDVPSNVRFEIADAAERWPGRMFDFIHVRGIVAGGGIRDWKVFLGEAFSHLNPGGYIEFTDIRPRFFDAEDAEVGVACRKIEKVFAETSVQQGVHFDPLPQVGEWLAELGAEGVKERGDWLPIGGDAGKGKLCGEVFDKGLGYWTLMLFGMGGWEESETRGLLESVKKEVRDPKLRSLVRM